MHTYIKNLKIMTIGKYFKKIVFVKIFLEPHLQSFFFKWCLNDGIGEAHGDQRTFRIPVVCARTCVSACMCARARERVYAFACVCFPGIKLRLSNLPGKAFTHLVGPREIFHWFTRLSSSFNSHYYFLQFAERPKSFPCCQYSFSNSALGFSFLIQFHRCSVEKKQFS